MSAFRRRLMTMQKKDSIDWDYEWSYLSGELPSDERFIETASGDISITENGVYEISYSTVGTDSTGAGTTSVQLREDGTEIPGTTASANVANANDLASLSASAIISVTSAPVTITLNMIGTNQAFTNTAVSVKKLD